VRSSTGVVRRRTREAVALRNTKPEIVVRKHLFSLGYRYRSCRGNHPITPNISFPGHANAIFVHGCFWHRHSGKLTTTPKLNMVYWAKKFRSNVLRDRRVYEALGNLEWSDLFIWQCEIKKTDALREKMVSFLN
jgi:DNA mismatch endonuclease, patch repair protein